MAYDTVVVGSGASGLTAAIVLARTGRSVALVERAPQTAPLLRRKRVRGFFCDLGFHYFGGLFDGSGFQALMRYLGIQEHLGAHPMDQDGFDRMILPDGRCLDIPVGFDKAEARLLDAFPDDAPAVRAYIERMRTLYAKTPFATIGPQPDEFTPTTRWEEPLEKLLRRAGAGQDLEWLLSTYGRILFGRSASEASMHMHTMAVGSYLQGAHSFEHGGDALANGLDEEARRCGVEIVCGSRVTKIVARNRRVEAVEIAASGTGETRRLDCDACIFTGHPRRLLPLLPADQLRSAFLRRMGELPETFAPFIIHVTVPSRLIPLGERNTYILGRPGVDATPAIGIMGSGGSELPSSEGAPAESMRSLSVIRMAWENDAGNLVCPGVALARCVDGDGRAAPGRALRYEDFRADLTSKTLERIYSVLPELRGKCRVLESMGPCEFERVSDGWRGSMYGARQELNNRILGPIGPLGGLFLAGQSIVTPGVAGAMVSALVAVGAMIGWDKWWPQVEACR